MATLELRWSRRRMLFYSICVAVDLAFSPDEVRKALLELGPNSEELAG